MDEGQLITGGAVVVALGAFKTIGFLVNKFMNGKKGNGHLTREQEQLIEHRKDIENLKEKNDDISKKMDVMTSDMVVLKTSITENGIICKDLTSKVDSVNSKLDRLVEGRK